MYLSKKSISELMASISQMETLVHLENLEYFLMRALLMKEDGIFYLILCTSELLKRLWMNG